MGKEQPKISIIIPVYNVESYIRDCLESLINQTYQNLEIILVDDGSTDSSGEICDIYCKKDKRIIVIHKANGGLVSARKAGLRIATGEYATYVDSDDWIDAKAYEEIMQVMLKYSPDIVVYDFIKQYSDFSNIEKIQLLQEGFYDKNRFFLEIEKCVKENPFFCRGIHFTVWSKLFKIDLLRKFQMDVDEEIRFGEDAAVLFPCMLDINSVYVMKKCFYHYRVRENSITTGKKVDEYYRYLKLADSLIKAAKNTKVWKEKIQKYLCYVLYYYLIICAPEYSFEKKVQFSIFPEIKKSDRIIIYGKGVFAKGIKESIQQVNFCTIVDNLDRKDIVRIKEIPEESYKFIIIAIIDFDAVSASRLLLEKMGINRNKILDIQKENLTLDNLPIEVRKVLDIE